MARRPLLIVAGALALAEDLTRAGDGVPGALTTGGGDLEVSS